MIFSTNPETAIECIKEQTEGLFEGLRESKPLLSEAIGVEDELYLKGVGMGFTKETVLNETVLNETSLNETVLNEPLLNEPLLNEPLLPESILHLRMREREERYKNNPQLSNIPNPSTILPELLQPLPSNTQLTPYTPNASRTLVRHQQATTITRPQWHAPWVLMKVITGHQGWVRSLAMDPENKWFATGAADSTIKIWDLASSRLRVTLAGHIMAVRALLVSDRHPYLFSASEDKTVKNWDLEKNLVVRDYHGHVSSVYSLDLHPNLDVLASAGRDAVVRVWDVRSRAPIHVIAGHTSSITNVKFQDAEPQLVSTSMDGTIRLYDLVAGKTREVLTHHKKAVRGLAIHPEEFTMATASSDDIKQWGFPRGDLLGSCYPNHTGIVNTLSVNDSNVLFSGADDGSMAFFDWTSGFKFQDTLTTPIPGSLASERGIFTSMFDRSGLRLLTGETDKSVKVWREDPEATPKTHPGNPWDLQMAV